MYELYVHGDEMGKIGNYAIRNADYRLQIPTVGASGAVFGLLLGFGMTFPEQRIYIYFLMPIKAKYFVAIYGLIELFSGFNNANSDIAHFAHIGGMLFGYLLLRYWKSQQFRRY